MKLLQNTHLEKFELIALLTTFLVGFFATNAIAQVDRTVRSSSTWSSIDQAARRGQIEAWQAFGEFQLSRNGRQAEFGGWIYRDENGRYGYTQPFTTGHVNMVRAPDVGVLRTNEEGDYVFPLRFADGGDETVVGIYHIHPAISGPQRDSNGTLYRHLPNQFSPADLAYSELFRVQMYVSTHDGNYYRYDPSIYDPAGVTPQLYRNGSFDVEELDHSDDGFGDAILKAIGIAGGVGGFVAAAIFGDPHMISHDGLMFDFQAAGEFYAVRDPQGNFSIQVRLEPFRGSQVASSITAISMGNGSGRIAVYAKEPHLVVDGVPFTESLPMSVNGFTIVRDGSSLIITGHEGDKVSIRIVSEDQLSITIVLPEHRRNRVDGLLGNFNGNPMDDQLIRSDTVLGSSAQLMSHLRNQRYIVWGNSLRITETESNFDYLHDDKIFEDYQIRNFPSRIVSYTEIRNDAEFDNAIAQCRATGTVRELLLERCAYDVLISRDSSSAEAYLHLEDDIFGEAGATEDSEVTFSGVLDKDTRRIIYEFEAKSGESYFFQLTSTSGTLDLSIAVIFDNEGRRLASACIKCNQIGVVDIVTSGKHRLEVEASENEAGEFVFRAINIPSSKPIDVAVSNSSELSETHRIAGELRLPGKDDLYRMKLSQGDRISLQVLERSALLVYGQVSMVSPEGETLYEGILQSGVAVEDLVVRESGPHEIRISGGDNFPWDSDQRTGTGRYEIEFGIDQ